MNKLKATSNLKMILDEVTETEEAICYVTSNDAETLKLAIEAIEQWNLVDQYKWERDVVLEQLKEICDNPRAPITPFLRSINKYLLDFSIQNKKYYYIQYDFLLSQL